MLRRHRLIELFLVKVLGMSWAEVHDEAERLEHAVSERLIDRIDEMLGRPVVDPHGDPIPTAEGTMPAAAAIERSTCSTAPLATPLVVTRVIDQDPEFLRFVEQHHLMPGSSGHVEARDPASDAVRLRVRRGQVETTLGTRAASQILVRLRH